MTPRRLGYFLAIVEAGSLTAAARRLGVAQPALSHHLRALEEDIGVALVERHARGVRVTAAGERLIRHARALERQYERIAADVRGADGTAPAGVVHVCVAASLSALVVPELLRRVRARAPAIDLNLHSPLSVRARRMLELGELDLGLLPGVADAEGLTGFPVYRETLSLIGPPDWIEPLAEPVPVPALAALPLVAPARDHDLRRHLESLAARAGIRLDIRYTIHDNTVVRALLEEGLAAAVLPRSAFGRLPSAGLASRALDLADGGRVLSIASLSGRPMTRAVALVAELLTDSLRALVTAGDLDGDLVHVRGSARPVFP